MRKRIVGALCKVEAAQESWLDLVQVARAELTSEDEAYPIEAALTAGPTSGWRAAEPGKQTIRILFDEATTIHRVQLVFIESERPRTQEFTLRWSADGGQSYREIVRQQYNFSPPDTCEDREDYGVDINGVTGLELSIVPDISDRGTFASLAQFLVA